MPAQTELQTFAPSLLHIADHASGIYSRYSADFRYIIGNMIAIAQDPDRYAVRALRPSKREELGKVAIVDKVTEEALLNIRLIQDTQTGEENSIIFTVPSPKRLEESASHPVIRLRRQSGFADQFVLDQAIRRTKSGNLVRGSVTSAKVAELADLFDQSATFVDPQRRGRRFVKLSPAVGPTKPTPKKVEFTSSGIKIIQEEQPPLFGDDKPSRR